MGVERVEISDGEAQDIINNLIEALVREARLKAQTKWQAVPPATGWATREELDARWYQEGYPE
jgi:hypothetical protein